MYKGLLSGFFVLRLLKIVGGSEMCDVLLGGPGMCEKVWQRRGGQNWPKIAWRTLPPIWLYNYGRIQMLVFLRPYLTVVCSRRPEDVSMSGKGRWIHGRYEGWEWKRNIPPAFRSWTHRHGKSATVVCGQVQTTLWILSGTEPSGTRHLTIGLVNHLKAISMIS